MVSNCTKPNIVPVLVIAEMTPSISAKLDTVTEMNCFIQTMRLTWTSVFIKGHNETASNVLLTIYNDSKIESQDSKIKGTVIIDDEYVNVTVFLNTSKDSNACELNKNYSCDITLTDTSIQTIRANTSFMIQAPLSTIEITADYSYVSGSNVTINCTVQLGDLNDTEVSLEVCQNGKYEDIQATEKVVQEVFKLDSDKNAFCTNQVLYSYHILLMDSRNGSYVRCHGNDVLYNETLSTKCVSINVTQVEADMEPEKLYGELNSTATFKCRIPLSQSYFSAFQFFNDSSYPLISINSDNNYTILPQNDRISAVYTSNQFDEYRAVNFTLDLRPGDDLCNLAGPYFCKVNTFNESLILPADDVGYLYIAAPPTDVSIEIEPSYLNASLGGDTINCTAIMNPNTTTLSLVILFNETYEMVPRNITEIFTGPMVTSDCRYESRVVVTATFDNFGGSTVACLAIDNAFGKEYFSTRETINITYEVH
ncbi:uncharacterized protein LOC133191215 [Saccostrea echinata]|uniref:uncharacterized protein LOC133181199 n=1 Tax=Saccostrea echinata TaxID=191078 RepID=UPI002A835A7E|nr:uncharacterized protein LOC133181199 [Saccostrea echinata]XP_061182938.1 uncharacterized protein LOC133191215 [Saccostrea echinata]